MGILLHEYIEKSKPATLSDIRLRKNGLKPKSQVFIRDFGLFI